MRPSRIFAKDFGSYPTLDLDLGQVEFAAIVGANGTGKSTLLDAIRVALFGQAAGSLDGFIRQGADKFQLSFTFEENGEEYVVYREHSRKGQKANLDVNQKPVCDAKVKAVDAAIIDLIGTDHAGFTLTQHLPQGMLTRFVTLTPSERKTWLIDNLPLAVYEELRERAATVLSDIENDLSLKRADLARDGEEIDLAALQQEVSEKGAAVEELEAQVRTIEAELDKASGDDEVWRAWEADLSQARAEAEKHEALHNGYLSRVRALDTSIADLEALTPPLAPEHTVEEAEAMVRDLQRHVAGEEAEARARHEKVIAARNRKIETHAAVEDAEQVRDAAQSKYNLASKTAREAWKKVEDYDHSDAATCAFCGADPQHQKGAVVLESHRAAAREADERTEQASLAVQEAEEKLAEYRRVHNDALDAFREAQAPVQETHPDHSAELEEAESHLRRAHEYQTAVAVYKEKQEQLNEAKLERRREAEAAAGAHTLWEEASAQAEEMQTHPPESGRVDVSDIQARLRAAEKAVVDAELASDRAQVMLTDAETRIAYRKELEDAIAQGTEQAQLAAMLAKAYSKTGIQARLIEEAVGYIEKSANQFLSEFTDGFAVELRTQALTKSDKLRETLDILVTDANGTRPLERFSGGETTRIAFALAAGLAEFIQAQTEAHVASFVVDEPEYLDPSGIQELVECLYIKARHTPLVLLVSHVDGVAEQIPQRIVVTKDGAGSKAVVA